MHCLVTRDEEAHSLDREESTPSSSIPWPDTYCPKGLLKYLRLLKTGEAKTGF